MKCIVTSPKVHRKNLFKMCPFFNFICSLYRCSKYCLSDFIDPFIWLLIKRITCEICSILFLSWFLLYKNSKHSGLISSSKFESSSTCTPFKGCVLLTRSAVKFVLIEPCCCWCWWTLNMLVVANNWFFRKYTYAETNMLDRVT